MLPVLFQGRDELAERGDGVRYQFQCEGQRPDGQSRDPALGAGVAEVVQCLRVLRAEAVLGAAHCRGGPCQVVESCQPRGSGQQPGRLAQRQRLAGRAQVPDQARHVTSRQQAFRLLKLLIHGQKLAIRPAPRPPV